MHYYTSLFLFTMRTVVSSASPARPASMKPSLPSSCSHRDRDTPVLIPCHCLCVSLCSTVDSLGPLWGLHLWHDNTGPSPTWYLRQVKVCEVKGKGRSWLFLGQCWLAVDEGDGWVEKRLRVFDQGP